MTWRMPAIVSTMTVVVSCTVAQIAEAQTRCAQEAAAGRYDVYITAALAGPHGGVGNFGWFRCGLNVRPNGNIAPQGRCLDDINDVVNINGARLIVGSNCRVRGFLDVSDQFETIRFNFPQLTLSPDRNLMIGVVVIPPGILLGSVQAMRRP